MSLAAPIGLLGGSFDPVHLGHVALGRAAVRELGLARLFYVPAGQPWQKTTAAPAGERLRMLELALAGFAEAAVDRRELERPGPTYTFDTLNELRGRSGHDQPLVWILGSDQIARIDTWHRWEEIPGLAHIAYARRPGPSAPLPDAVARTIAARSSDAAGLRRQSAGLVVEFPMDPVDCSSTRLRERLAAGDLDGAAPMLAPAVMEHLRLRNPYGP